MSTNTINDRDRLQGLHAIFPQGVFGVAPAPALGHGTAMLHTTTGVANPLAPQLPIVAPAPVPHVQVGLGAGVPTPLAAPPLHPSAVQPAAQVAVHAAQGAVTPAPVSVATSSNSIQHTRYDQTTLTFQEEVRRRDAEAKARQQQRNREHAKRSRARKKEAMSQLEEEAEELRQENERLKQIVRQKIPERAQSIFKECNLHQSDFQLLENLTANKQSFVLTDPRLPDNPIVYASERFCELTQYERDQVVGRNCRFLQGPDTSHKAVELVRNAIRKGVDATTVMLNYKADGTPFWNRFFVAALRDRDHKIVNYVGVQCEQDGPQDTLLKSNVPPDESLSSSSPSIQPIIPSTSNGAAAMDTTTTGTMNANVASVASSNGFKKAEDKGTAIPFLPEETTEEIIPIEPQDHKVFDDIDFDKNDIEQLDWSILAEALEADYKEELNNALNADDGNGLLSNNNSNDDDDWTMTTSKQIQTIRNNRISRYDLSMFDDDEDEERQLEQESYLKHFIQSPKDFTTRTVRSEVIDSLLVSNGDVTDARFVSALSVLSTMYSSSGQNASLTALHNGSWRSISRPSYQGCLGTNDYGDFVYTLGKMSFDMFKPGNLRCSVQETLNNIDLVCKMDGAPTAAPWSLRRELAAWDQHLQGNEGGENGTTLPQTNNATMLKSYDIAVALTIEPGPLEPPTPTAKTGEPPVTPPSHRPLRALKIVQGYMLPDPNTPNRLTVWFTGGKLSPAPPPKDSTSSNSVNNKNENDSSSKYGSFEEWKAVFGGKHKRTWGESLRVMGAKLLLGAELPDGMDKDGTMKYTLHRPVGGHGSSYVDVLYLDKDLLITRGNRGTVHVMTQGRTPKDDDTTSLKKVANSDPVSNGAGMANNANERGKKRKAAALTVAPPGGDVTTNEDEPAKNRPRRPVTPLASADGVTSSGGNSGSQQQQNGHQLPSTTKSPLSPLLPPVASPNPNASVQSSSSSLPPPADDGAYHSIFQAIQPFFRR